MKIAIHDRPGSFSDRWIEYCDINQVPYKLVNCYDSNIINELSGCDGLMWHWDQNDYKATLFAKQLTFSLERAGMKLFPDVNTCWHFDDKLGQKYLMEALGAPLVPSYVFYSRKDALAWLQQAEFPKVFKLRVGSSSVNVRLAKTRRQAERLVEAAFSAGFSHIDRFARLKDRWWVLKSERNLQAVRGLVSGFARLFIPTEVERFSSHQKGYVYFQDFIAGNNYDTRLIVIGNRCFGARRYCRTGDFRASGSGLSVYEPELLDPKCIQVAFDTAKRLKLQSVAFDLIWDGETPKIVEISYCFPGAAADKCQGYWDPSLKWHNERINPPFFMIADLVDAITATYPGKTAAFSPARQEVKRNPGGLHVASVQTGEG